MKSNLKTCFGISSECNDGKHILFLDYDKKELPKIIDELKTFQMIYTLSDFYILSTENGYNVICLDKFDFSDLLDIYEHSKLIDSKFVRYCRIRRHFTLRMDGSKKMEFVLTSTNKYRQKSNAHRIFFRDVMNYNIIDGSKFDRETSIYLESFFSRKHGIYLKGECYQDA